ncbi:MAG: biotin--[acetyl-CoA-carboxylase] ligase [Planctomycetia bacterium]|nr:biotin--[acetyl-CoA-carboxylase] ligase [Planctomycetia bacterium]
MAEKSHLTYSAEDLRRLRTETFLREVEPHAEIGSTNDRALVLCGEPNLPVPYLILTERQTAGRGRGANRWWSSDGALMFSVVINAKDYALPESRWPQISLTVGVAVCETLAILTPTTLTTASRPHSVGLKWPNDVWLNRRKVCGILMEVPPTRCGQLVIGVGLNVNNSFADAPAELSLIATSLSDETGVMFDRTSVLATLLQQLDRDLKRLANAEGSLVETWQSRCVLRGRMVSLDSGQRVVTGLCMGIAADGALRLQSPNGEQRFYGGLIHNIE